MRRVAPTTSGAAFRWSRWMPQRTRQHGGSGLKSTTGACRGGSLAWVAEGGCCIKNQVSDPIGCLRAPLNFRPHPVGINLFTFFQWEFIFVRHYVRMWFTSCMIVGLDR